MRKITIFSLLILLAGSVFGQSYNDYLTKAKNFEAKKLWCQALGAYYDALGTDEEPSKKKEALQGYSELSDLIKSGNPGKGKFNPFAMHDEWKNLLIDAEKYGSSFPIYTLQIGDLVQGELDYQTRTATYSAKIDYKHSDRYLKTIGLINTGYEKAFKQDWSKDLPYPDEWPLKSVSSNKDAKYNINGTYIFQDGKYFYNAFAYVYRGWTSQRLYDYKFNIVDETGRELVKGKRFLLGNSDIIVFPGIKPEIMDAIDNGKAFLNPVAVYLEYGKYNRTDDNGGRTFIKNLPEVELPIDKAVFEGAHRKGDVAAQYFFKASIVDFELKEIPGKNIKISSTEVTQKLYDLVMGINPSYFEGENLPVESVTWYDAITFCNKLSEMEGLTPVYTIKNTYYENGVVQNTEANGYRLPTQEEWRTAAMGGENYTYAGGDSCDEVAWCWSNSDDKTHPVGQKKPNGFGLYDMTGNVWEWCWDAPDDYNNSRYLLGGGYDCDQVRCRLTNWRYDNSSSSNKNLGFRIVRNIK